MTELEGDQLVRVFQKLLIQKLGLSHTPSLGFTEDSVKKSRKISGEQQLCQWKCEREKEIQPFTSKVYLIILMVSLHGAMKAWDFCLHFILPGWCAGFLWPQLHVSQ